MRRQILAIDVTGGLLLAVLILVIASGLAVVAIIAIFALLICAISFALDARPRRRRASRRTRAWLP